MPDTNSRTQTGGAPLWRRRRFWLGGGVLVGLAALTAVAPRAWAHRGVVTQHFGGPGRHAFGAQLLKDPEAAKRHAGMAVEWALRGVDATAEQKQRAKGIAERLIDQLVPLGEKHREHHVAMAHELVKAEIDREALERLRREELELADEASKRVVDAIAELGETLTPEQRRELAELVHRFHGEGPLP
jgi:periplasmic protein CpxP/Spy